MEKDTLSAALPAHLADSGSLVSLDAPLSMHPDDAWQEDDALPPAPMPDPEHIVIIFGTGRVAEEVTTQAARAGFTVDILPDMPEGGRRTAHAAHDEDAPLLPDREEDPTDSETAAAPPSDASAHEARLDALADRFPLARHVLPHEDYVEFSEEYPLDARHYAVILTQDADAGQLLLAEILHTSVRYIGVLADAPRKETLFDALRRQGTPDAELACVRCPIGLPIGAQTPHELGIAIAAELIAARAGCLPRARY